MDEMYQRLCLRTPHCSVRGENRIMKITMKQWEIERTKEIVSDVLALWSGNFIEVNDGHGSGRSMSKETFLKQLEERLKMNE